MSKEEIDRADQRLFTVSAEEYDRIQAELERPARALPRLAALMARRSTIALPSGDES